MEGSFFVSLVIGVVSVTLALVAIWHSTQSERKSTENYHRTKEVLAEISEKSAVIANTVSNTQSKLVDTITEIARPTRESTDEMLIKTLLPAMLEKPELMEQFSKLAQQQEGTQR